MLQDELLVKDRPVSAPWPLPVGNGDAEREELVRVLERAAQDDGFIAQLTDHGDEALQSYHLTWQARAALLSGDLNWLEARLGRLDARLRTWPDCRLQQENW